MSAAREILHAVQMSMSHIDSIQDKMRSSSAVWGRTGELGGRCGCRCSSHWLLWPRCSPRHNAKCPCMEYARGIFESAADIPRPPISRFSFRNSPLVLRAIWSRIKRDSQIFDNEEGESCRPEFVLEEPRQKTKIQGSVSIVDEG